MAQWHSEYAILRDLSVAQGRVPVAIERTVGAGDKPPSLNITEETEEEFFKYCSADANVSAAPDLGLIQKMLDMVRDDNEWPDDDTEKAVLISKVNPLLPEFTPAQKNTSTPNDRSPTRQKEKQKKRQRNIALESILQAIADKNKNNDVILLKPNDFISNNIETKNIPTEKEPDIEISKDNSGGDNNISSTPTAAEKVNGWFETQTESPFPKKTVKVTLEATNIIFKRKEKKKKIEKVPKENFKKLEKSPISLSSNSGEYKPSTLANEYYQMFVERNKFKDSVKEDIWTKAERKMKEIDEKRRGEAVQALTSPSSASQASGLAQSFEETQSTDTFTARVAAETKISRCLDLVALPQHRHLLTGVCIVCEAMNNNTVRKTKIFEENNDMDIILDTKNGLESAEMINIPENADSISKHILKKEDSNNIDLKDKDTINEESINILTDKKDISNIINEQLAKFVENTDLNRKLTEYVESPKCLYEDFKSYAENEDSSSDIGLDRANVYECVPKTELPFEAVLSDRSF